MFSWAYALELLFLVLSLPVFSYLTLIYRELGRMTTGRVHEHLEIFEAEIEPRLRINRKSGGRTFRILGHFWLAFLVLQTTRGIVHFVPGQWESAVQFVLFFSMHFIPDILLYRTTGRWLLPLLPLIRLGMWVVWPVRVFLEAAESLARISEQEQEKTEEQRTEEGIEALVEAAEEEGIIEPDQADLIEQVVEFSDKRVREVMTPRPDIVAVPADLSLEALHAKVVETKLSKLPVYEKDLDAIFGVVNAQYLLHIAYQDLPRRKVRELAKPVLFIPETKSGSDLLRELRAKAQQLAVVIDEHGTVAGLVTIEDLVEEIVGESGSSAKAPQPAVLREPDGSLLVRGSTAIRDVEELLGVRFGRADDTVTTIAGLLSHISGKVLASGDRAELEGYRFEVLEANQRKILKLRIRKIPAHAAVQDL